MNYREPKPGEMPVYRPKPSTIALGCLTWAVILGLLAFVWLI